MTTSPNTEGQPLNHLGATISIAIDSKLSGSWPPPNCRVFSLSTDHRYWTLSTVQSGRFPLNGQHRGRWDVSIRPSPILLAYLNLAVNWANCPTMLQLNAHRILAPLTFVPLQPSLCPIFYMSTFCTTVTLTLIPAYSTLVSKPLACVPQVRILWRGYPIRFTNVPPVLTVWRKSPTCPELPPHPFHHRTPTNASSINTSPPFTPLRCHHRNASWYPPAMPAVNDVAPGVAGQLHQGIAIPERRTGLSGFYLQTAQSFPTDPGSQPRCFEVLMPGE